MPNKRIKSFVSSLGQKHCAMLRIFWRSIFAPWQSVMPMKKLAVFVIIFLFSIELYANESCNKVVSGYEKSDLMYVVCPNLPNLTLEQMNAAVKAVMAQNTIVMDEILVYFVATKGDVGNDNLKPNNFVGFYYTHDSILTLWPDIESNRKDIKIDY